MFITCDLLLLSGTVDVWGYIFLNNLLINIPYHYQCKNQSSETKKDS